jgi:PAS domain S-box-containing protein
MAPTQTAPHLSQSLLVIEDDQAFGAVLQKMITARLGEVSVHLATTLQEGLELLRRQGADLVLLDLGLPDSEGLSSMDLIRATGADPAVIFLTGRRDEQLALQAMAMGAQDYLLKGNLDLEAIVNSIRYARERKAWQTSLLEAETRRRASERLLAATLDSMQAAIAIADRQGVLVAANAVWKAQDADSNPFIPEGEPQSFDFAAFCRASLEKGGTFAPVAQGFLRVLSGEEERFVVDFRVEDHPGARGFGVTIYRFRVEGDPHIGIAIADNTERIRESRELKKAHAIQNLILENSMLGIAFVRQRVFEWANSRVGEMLGLPMERVLGSLTRTIYPDQASYEELGQKTYERMRQGERADVTWQLQKADGSLFWCRLIGSPLNSDQPEDGSVWLLEDTTERVNAEQDRLSLEVQLRQAQKLEAIGQLAAGIAHEINTPTQYIGDNTKFLEGAFKEVFQYLEAMEAALPPGALPDSVARLKDEADLPFLRAEIPKAIEQSLEGIDRVSRIVRAMKDFSHPGNDKPVEVDLNRSIESTITVSRNEWKYVAELVLDLDPNLGPVHCYPNEMNQVVLNLVINAAHAIADTQVGDFPAKGTITISTARSEDMAEIRVGDSGSGIPEHVRPRIFDPFFTTKGVGKGTGQGLAIVHSVVVERHHGTVTFETEVGKGTVFTLRIPLLGAAVP